MKSTSEMTTKLNAALVKARAEMKNPSFDSNNPFFSSSFASLKSVIATVTPVFAEHGLAFIQDLQTIDGGVGCYTTILHESGEEKTFGPLVMMPTKHDAQGQGSAATYARRYHLMAIAGVVGDVDDDGNSASKAKPVETITEKQVADLEAKITEVGADRPHFLEYMKIGKLEDIPAHNYSRAIAALEKKAGK